MAKENIDKKITENNVKNYKGNVTMFVIGVFIAIAGYLLLTLTNKGGNNWASYVSPFSIVTGYIVIALSLIIDFPPSQK